MLSVIIEYVKLCAELIMAFFLKHHLEGQEIQSGQIMKVFEKNNQYSIHVCMCGNIFLHV